MKISILPCFQNYLFLLEFFLNLHLSPYDLKRGFPRRFQTDFLETCLFSGEMAAVVLAEETVKDGHVCWKCSLTGTQGCNDTWWFQRAFRLRNSCLKELLGFKKKQSAKTVLSEQYNCIHVRTHRVSFYNIIAFYFCTLQVPPWMFTAGSQESIRADSFYQGTCMQTMPDKDRVSPAFVQGQL